MLNFLYDLFPVILFFVAFKFYGIYVATVVGIVATGIQAILSLVILRKWDKKLWITFAVFVLFGGMTLYFHNPIFVKWKPTIIFWIFSLLLLGSHWVGEKPIMQRILGKSLETKTVLPLSVWQRLNFAWMLFFFILGAINLFVAYQFTDEVWVNFKLYGVTGLLLVFSILQAMYLMRHMDESQYK